MKRWLGLFLTLAAMAGAAVIVRGWMQTKLTTYEDRLKHVRTGMTAEQAIHLMSPHARPPAVIENKEGIRDDEVKALVWSYLDHGFSTRIVDIQIFIGKDGCVTRKTLDGKEVE